MAEWFNAAVLKTVVLKGTGGSNPSFSAQRKRNSLIIRGLRFFLTDQILRFVRRSPPIFPVFFYKKQPDFSELKKILASLND